MKLTAKGSNIILEEVFSGIELKTDAGETLGICMRDSGFEFLYGGKWYSAKNGVIMELRQEGKVTGPEDFWVECSVCHTHIKNWTGSTACCGALAFLVEDGKSTGKMSLFVQEIADGPIVPAFIGPKNSEENV